MVTVIVNVPDKEQFRFQELLKKLQFKSKVLSEEDKKDIWLYKMIDEAEEEGGEVSEAEVIKTLKQNGAKIQA